MALTKLTTDVQNIQKLADRPNQTDGLTAAQVKATYDKAGEDIKAYINDTLTVEMDTSLASKTSDLNTHKDSNDHDGRYYTETEISSTVDGISGSDKVGVTTIPTLAGNTVQAVLESAKARFDDIAVTNVNVEVANTHIGADDRTYATLPARLDSVDSRMAEIANSGIVVNNILNLSFMEVQNG